MTVLMFVYKVWGLCSILYMDIFYAAEGQTQEKLTSYDSYYKALHEHKADNLWYYIQKFTAEDAVKQDSNRKTVGIDFLNREKYGLLSDLLNTAICHLVTVASLEVLFNQEDL